MRLGLRAPATLLLLLMLPSVHAAGGHFDVDDAALLDPGRCQVETWLVRTSASSTRAAHLGPACRFGAVEFGLNIEHSSGAAASRNASGPQLKWATDPGDTAWAAGLVWAVSFEEGKSGRPAHHVYAPLTWRAADTLQIHTNAGADWQPGRGRTRRLGAAAEWAVHQSLSLTVERSFSALGWTSRLGLRASLGDAFSVDLSSASSGAAKVRGIALGLNFEFAR